MASSGWGTFLASVSGPIAKKVLTAVGVGTLTIVGMQTALESALNAVRDSLGGMTGVVADLVAMAGFFSAVSVIAGGLSAAVSITVMKRFAQNI